MQPTSTAQFEALRSKTVPEIEQVRDGIHVVGMPMTGTGIVAYTLTVLILDAQGGVHVVDPGWNLEGNLERLERSLGTLGRRLTDVASIVTTHLHADHLGLAVPLREASGAPLVMHRIERDSLGNTVMEAFVGDTRRAMLDSWGVPEDRRDDLGDRIGAAHAFATIEVDRVVEDGDRLDVPGRDLRAMLTPGHTAGHLCLRDDADGVLLTGDHVLPHINPGVGLGIVTATNPLADYLASLEYVAGYGDHEALPGHGYRFTGLGDRCREIAAHHLARNAEVRAQLGHDEQLTVWQLASRLHWSAGWENLHGLLLRSALAQVAMHVDYAGRGAGQE